MFCQLDNKFVNTKAPPIHKRSPPTIAYCSFRFIMDKLSLQLAEAAAADRFPSPALVTVAVLIRWRVTVNNACATASWRSSIIFMLLDGMTMQTSHTSGILPLLYQTRPTVTAPDSRAA